MNEDSARNTATLNQYLAAVARGDRFSFFELYRRTSPHLFAFAFRLTRSRDIAEDVLQDAFVRIWTRAADWDETRGSAMTWMASIVRNRAIDILRKNTRAVNYALDLTQNPAPPMAPDAAMPGWEEVGQIRDCIEQLDANQRKAVLLAYFEGLTHEQLSVRLQAPLGTVKSWLRRGLIRLKHCLER